MKYISTCPSKFNVCLKKKIALEIAAKIARQCKWTFNNSGPGDLYGSRIRVLGVVSNLVLGVREQD
jgi:hypothetical protein